MNLQSLNKNKRKKYLPVVFIFFAALISIFIFNIASSDYAHAQVMDYPTGVEDTSGSFNILPDIGGAISTVFGIVIYGVVFVPLSILLVAAGFMFDWVINPATFTSVMNMTAVYTSWQMIRDFLNIAFIFILLFSAFATIFQVEKYNFKKILLTLVIMALLVNFSFPIARFIIDVSNVMFYYILETTFPAQDTPSVSAEITKFTNIADMLVPREGGSNRPDYSNFTGMTMAIIFLFLFMVTMMVLAFLFLIRLVILVLLIIFSPIGFVAAIFPSTKNFSDMWWQKLFKYSFFAPVMAFMLLIAVKMMQELNQGTINAAINASAEGYSNGTIATIVSLLIPIVILWVGMISAQQLGDGAANFVIGRGKSVANWGRKAPWRSAKWGAAATGLSGGVRQRYENVAGKLRSKQAQREAKVAGFKMQGKGKLGKVIAPITGIGAVGGARERDMERRAEEYKKNKESESSLHNKAMAGDTAAAYRLSQDGNMSAKTYESFKDKIDKDPKLKGSKLAEMIDKKTSEKTLDVVVKYKVEKARASGAAPAVVNDLVKNEYSKLDADGWKKQKNIENVVTPGHADHSPEITANAGAAFNDMHGDARKDVGKSSSGKKLAALRSVPPPNNFNIP